MKHFITIKQEKQFGLEVWTVWCKGTLVGTHMSKAGAVTAARKLADKLNQNRAAA